MTSENDSLGISYKAKDVLFYITKSSKFYNQLWIQSDMLNTSKEIQYNFRFFVLVSEKI